jgi:hypothetical protein
VIGVAVLNLAVGLLLSRGIARETLHPSTLS